MTSSLDYDTSKKRDMKVEFADSFWQSLSEMARRDRPINRALRFVTRTVPRFLANVWRFRGELASHEWWDYSHTLAMMRRSLSIVRDGLAERGQEVPDSRLAKVDKIGRAIDIIDNILLSRHLDMAESRLGPVFPGLLEGTLTEEQSEHNSRVYALGREIEEAEWRELFRILEGQDPSTFGPGQEWNEWFDGSGMRGWWD